MFEEMRSRFVLGWMLSVSIVVIFMLLQFTGNVLITGVLVQLIFYVVLPGWLLSYHLKKRSVKLRQIVFFRGTARWLMPIFGLTVLLVVFSMSVYWLLLRALIPITPPAIDSMLMPQPAPDALWYLVATGFIIAVIAPIAEEFVFRGLLLNRLIAAFGFRNGLGLASVFFGVLHINFFGAFLFAVVASLLYLKTANLLVPILLHIANNTVAVYQSYVNPSFPQWLKVTSINDLYTKSVPNLIVLIVSFVLLLFIISQLTRGSENKIEELRVFWK